MLVSSDCHYFEVNIVFFPDSLYYNNDIHLEGKEQFYYVDFPQQKESRGHTKG